MRIRGLVSILLLATSLAGLNCSLLNQQCIHYGGYTANGEKIENVSFIVKPKDYDEMRRFFDRADSLYEKKSPKLREHLATHPEYVSHINQAR